MSLSRTAARRSRRSRRFPTAPARASLAALGMAAFLAAASHASATQKEFATGTEWLTGADWNPTGVPGAGDNVLIDTGSPGSTAAAPYSITSGTLTVEDLTDTATSAANFLSNTGSTDSTLTLNGGRGSTVPLIEMGSTKSFTIQNGPTNALNLVLAASGSIDVAAAGKLTISSNIGETGGARTLTITNTSAFATPGAIAFSGTNTFSGGLVITGTGNELDVSADASLGAAGGSITISGARLGIATTSFTVDPTRNIFLGANPTGGNTTGTLSIKGTITTTFNQGLQNAVGATGDLVKQGGGTLVLGGVSTYTGNTFLNNGITQITNGNNRLPTTTTVALGQTASANVGTLDLNGFNQQIAGLNSTNATTGAPVTKNTVTAVSGPSTLTLGGSGNYAYGDGSANNSGVITDGVGAATGAGVLSLVKTGAGTQTLGDANTYTGTTTISGGKLILTNAAGSSATGIGTVALSGGTTTTLSGNGVSTGLLTVTAASRLAPGVNVSGTNTNFGTAAKLTLGTTGGMTLTNASLDFDLSTTAAGANDSIATGNTLTLGKLAFTFNETGGTLAMGTAYQLITGATTVGGFSAANVTTAFVNGTAYTAIYAPTAGGLQVTFSPVPEPSTYALMALGTVGLLAATRRRQTA